MTLPTEIIQDIYNSENAAFTFSVKVRNVLDPQAYWPWACPLLIMQNASITDVKGADGKYGADWPFVAFFLRQTSWWNIAGEGWKDGNAWETTAASASSDGTTVIGEKEAENTKKISTTDWTNLTYVVTSNEMSIYRDGVLVTTINNVNKNQKDGSIIGTAGLQNFFKKTATGNTGTDADGNSFDFHDQFLTMDSIRLGGSPLFAWEDADAQIYFDDVAFYMSALTQKQIAALSVYDFSINNNTAGVSLLAGRTKTLTTSFAPDNDLLSSSDISWSSSDEKIATVDNNGKVTGITDGTVTITAKLGLLSSTCQVTVTSTEVKVTSISATADKSTLTIGDTATITTGYEPANTTDETAPTFVSSDTGIITVNERGVVTAVAAGTAKVTVTIAGMTTDVEFTVSAPATETTQTDSTKKASKVTVKAAGYTGSTITLVKGKTATISATVTPAKASQKVTYKSSNKKVATVSNKGVVKGVKAGTAKITVTAADGSGKKATVTVKVVKKAVANKALKLKKSAVTLKKKGATATIAIKSQTKGTTDTITYTLDKAGKKLVSVDKFGVVTVKKAPTKKAQKAVVTVKCGKKSAKYTITLKK